MELEKLAPPAGFFAHFRRVAFPIQGQGLPRAPACAARIRRYTEARPGTDAFEREINAVVLACMRARRQILKAPDFSGPTFH